MSNADPKGQPKSTGAPPPAPPGSERFAPPPLPPVQPPPTAAKNVAARPTVVIMPAGAPQTVIPSAPPVSSALKTKVASPAPRPAQPLPAARTKLVIPIAASEQPPDDITESAMKSAPPFLVSMLVHMVLIIVLALISFSNKGLTDQLQLKAVYAEATGQQLIDDKLQSPETLDMKLETPVLAFGMSPADDPLATPPKLPDFFDGASSANSRMEAPSIGMALTGRETGMKKALLGVYGASATTEASVVAGLEWLKKHQMRDGGWSLVGPFKDGALTENRCAATAMALLAFQGYGATHVEGATSPDFHDVVDRGWTFLLKMQDKEGFFQHEGTMNHRAYAQAQATIALCEIYGMTKDQKFKRPAQLALDWAHKAQSPELGGWRYQPRVDSDTSVTGWYVMAFQSGLMAGLEVQSPNLALINEFLDKVQHEGGTQYSYQIGEEPRLTMTAEALLCRQYLGWKHDDPRMRAGIDQLLANRIDYEKDHNVYYWYYATQACHHMDGDDWNRWNAVMRQAVPAAQTKTGSEKGSWTSSGDRWGSHGGRLYTTCLSIFMLETYYRHLPIYKWRLQ